MRLPITAKAMGWTMGQPDAPTNRNTRVLAADTSTSSVAKLGGAPAAVELGNGIVVGLAGIAACPP